MYANLQKNELLAMLVTCCKAAASKSEGLA
jgi:hypothetical protein